MRVIAGRYRGRSLEAPPGSATRPILDRVKVSVFDWLGSMLAIPGSLPPIAVLDLFCGGGSLGIEALSRGASHCTFVDSDRTAIGCLRRNLKSLGIIAGVQVLQGSAQAARPRPPTAAGYDLVFLDPPYRLSEEVRPGTVLWQVLDRLGAITPVGAGAVALWRHDESGSAPGMLPGGWTVAERRSWGTMAVTMLRRGRE